MSGFTDIRLSGWVAHVPPRFLPYVLLARLDRPVGVWLLFLPGLWAICLAAHGFWAGLWLAALFAVGSVVMRGAGCVVNDLWDRKMDAQVERTRGRPLASGAVTPMQALVFLALLCLVGLGILLLLNRTAQILGVCSLLLVALYPAAKRVTWWPQVVLGFTFGWGAPMGYAAATGHFCSWPSLCLYGAAVLWILGYDTIYAHQDREDDTMIGVKSTARLFGATNARDAGGVLHRHGSAGAAGHGGLWAACVGLRADAHPRRVARLAGCAAGHQRPGALPRAVQAQPRGGAGGGGGAPGGVGLARQWVSLKFCFGWRAAGH